MRRRHRMPFGAELLDSGAVRFRLWAPTAKRVELCLLTGAEEQVLAMQQESDDWFDLTTERARAGAHYRFRIDEKLQVPDPASRFQPKDVLGPSAVIDPSAWEWHDEHWRGRPWEEVVLYELHVGTFTPEGTYTGVKKRLDHLVALGVTAIELMPLADFPGAHNWGYDGVLLFAPDSAYGTPAQLKDLIQTAHAKGLMVFIDVVYNHFGPEGNYLHAYAESFFTQRYKTPWGDAINYDGEHSREVRRFVIENALYWFEEYHVDGLRLDAVHAIFDESKPDILQELAQAVMNGPGKRRHTHLVLENDDNEARYLERNPDSKPRYYAAQWNDDIHHALHTIATGQASGYYADYADRPMHHLGRCLTEGFAYQDDPSGFRNGERRGESSTHVPVTAFVSFLQNHDQIGNRAFGERIAQLASPEAVRAVTAVMLLAPAPPLLFMGQEWAAPEPFLFFCDFGPELARLVTEGRRKEFARFPEFSDPKARDRIPDPAAPKTYETSKLNWQALSNSPHEQWLSFHRDLLNLRAREIMPRLPGLKGGSGVFHQVGERGLTIAWTLGDGTKLNLYANLGPKPLPGFAAITGRVIYELPPGAVLQRDGMLPSWSVVYFFS